MRITRISRRNRAAAIQRPARRKRPVLPAPEWAEDATGRCPRVTAVGGRSLLVENHTGLLSFTDTGIVLDSRSGPLRVTGDGLSLSCVRSGALIVEGRIRCVELPCEGGVAPDER